MRSFDVFTEPDSLSACEIVFIFVKAYDTEAAAASLCGRIGKETIIVSLQNGLGNAEAIARRLPGQALVYGSTSIGACFDGSNRLVLGGIGETVIGSADPKALDAAAGAISRAGLPLRICAEPAREVWQKVAVNCAINPLGALLGLRNGEIARNPDLASLQSALVTEACDVARAEGWALKAEDIIDRVRATCELTSVNRSSMLQDIEAGRRTEIDALNGAVAARGQASGLAVPLNAAMRALVSAAEAAAIDRMRKNGRR